MSMLLMAKAFGINVGSASRKLVLLKLADNANDAGECWPSYKHIADQCEMSKRSAMIHIEALCKAGLIQKQSRKGPKGNSTNIYVVTLDSAKSALGGEVDSLGGEESALGGEVDSLGGSEESAPGISHSFESANESPNEPLAQDDSAAPNQSAAARGQVVNFPAPAKPKCHIPDDLPGPKDPSCKTYKAWVNYAVTYQRRYGAYPLWNAKVAGQFSQLVDRVGADNAPGVAAHYLSLNTQFYVAKSHSVGALLNDCEAIYTQWITGRQMTNAKARQIDSTQSNMSNAEETVALIRAGWGE